MLCMLSNSTDALGLHFGSIEHARTECWNIHRIFVQEGRCVECVIEQRSMMHRVCNMILALANECIAACRELDRDI